MSSMTMTMFVPHIWGYDLASAQAKIALQAGWSRSDLIWEHLMEAAVKAHAQGQGARAKRLTRRAHWLARLRFAADDPRRVTGLVNLALLSTGSARAKHLQSAAKLWSHSVTPAIASMQIAPRSRSSLFHLRMEALHRDTFHDNMRTRFTKFANETAQTIAALQAGDPAPHRHYSRWRGEKPVVYDDTRKVLAACLLIFDA